MSEILIGRLLRANSQGCVAGCQITQALPAFGAMVRIQIKETEMVYGVISNIFIDDDGLVRQLAAGSEIPEEIIQDNRLNRNVPVELRVRFIGYALAGRISHSLPPHPPLSLDRMTACQNEEICIFTNHGQYAYLRHILTVDDIPPADLAAAHFMQTHQAQTKSGNQTWLTGAIQNAIQFWRDDPANLHALLTDCSTLLPDDTTINQEVVNG